MPVILKPRRWRQENPKFIIIIYKFKTSLGYMRSYIKIIIILIMNIICMQTQHSGTWVERIKNSRLAWAIS